MWGGGCDRQQADVRLGQCDVVVAEECWLVAEGQFPPMLLILRPPGYSGAALSWTPSDGPLGLGSSPGHVWFLGDLEVSGGKMEMVGSGWLAGTTSLGTGRGARVLSPRGVLSPGQLGLCTPGYQSRQQCWPW